MITLATTNQTVSRINQEALELLPGKSKIAHADIEGEFGSKAAYPADRELVLKPKARVMFLRNDFAGSDGPRYANGTLGGSGENHRQGSG